MMYGLMSFDLLERMLEDRQWSRKRYGESFGVVVPGDVHGRHGRRPGLLNLHWLGVCGASIAEATTLINAIAVRRVTRRSNTAATHLSHQVGAAAG